MDKLLYTILLGASVGLIVGGLSQAPKFLRSVKRSINYADYKYVIIFVISFMTGIVYNLLVRYNDTNTLTPIQMGDLAGNSFFFVIFPLIATKLSKNILWPMAVLGVYIVLHYIGSTANHPNKNYTGRVEKQTTQPAKPSPELPVSKLTSEQQAYYTTSFRDGGIDTQINLPTKINLIRALNNQCTGQTQSDNNPIIINDGRWYSIQKLVDICFSSSENSADNLIPAPMTQNWGAILNHDITYGDLYCLPNEVAYQHYKQVNVIKETGAIRPKVQLDLEYKDEQILALNCKGLVSRGMKMDYNFDGVADYILSHIPYADSYSGWCGASGPCRIWLYDGRTNRLLGEGSASILAISNVIYNKQPIIIDYSSTLHSQQMTLSAYDGDSYNPVVIQKLSADKPDLFQKLKNTNPAAEQVFSLPEFQTNQ